MVDDELAVGHKRLALFVLGGRLGAALVDANLVGANARGAAELDRGVGAHVGSASWKG